MSKSAIADLDASEPTCWAARARTSPRWRALGLPVPPGFTITTEVCTVFYYYANGNAIRTAEAQVEAALAGRKITGQKFGDPRSNPLLVSVRSGARASMPGMMDTVLNLGLNDETVEGLLAKSGDRALRL
jgi:pyruvate,orthophosphate dikinase